MAQQLTDDLQLLDLMMRQVSDSPDLYKPTNYWHFYQTKLLPELRYTGLKDYRRRYKSVLASFGAADIPVMTGLKYHSLQGRVIARIKNKVFSKALFEMQKAGCLETTIISPTQESIVEYFHKYVKEAFLEVFNRSMDGLGTTTHGNPEHVFKIDGGLWSLSHLLYLKEICDAAKYINLPNDLLYVEIGGGMCRTIEILANLLPNATFVDFDLPPQLYVAHQYLQKVFGDRLVDYNSALRIPAPGSEGIPSEIRGKIILLHPAKIQEWSGLRPHICWNSASFQEMEPEVVKNYLDCFKSMRPDHVYLSEVEHGHSWVNEKEGDGGVKVPVDELLYIEQLSEKYSLKVKYDKDVFMAVKPYKCYVFTRN